MSSINIYRKQVIKRGFALRVLICAYAVTGMSCVSTGEAPPDIVALETRIIEQTVARLESKDEGSIQYSIWLGPPDGESWYTRNAQNARPAASAIKSAILIEFFSEQINSLDAPFAGLSEIIDNPDSPAIRHFDLEQKAAARRELRGLTARQLAEAMIHKEHVQSNAAYNAAANVIIQHLGGPKALTKRVRRRFPHADGLVIARYMLADRKKNDDNLLTARSLAKVLQFLAEGAPNDPLRAAARPVLLLETDPVRGDHYYKGGTLTSPPQVRIEAGWWELRGAASVYVVIATRPIAANNENEKDFDELRANLKELSNIVQDAGIHIRDASPALQ